MTTKLIVMNCLYKTVTFDPFKEILLMKLQLNFTNSINCSYSTKINIYCHKITNKYMFTFLNAQIIK